MSTERGHTYGGQAVIEGVMIRGRTNVSVAVRRPDGTIALQSRRLSPLFTGRLRQIPLVRGVIALMETLILGMRALSYSANVGIEEEGEEVGKVSMVSMMLVSLLFAIGLFFLVPVFASRGLEGALGSGYATNIAEGLIRLGIFLAYILLIGRMSDIRRVFMYHGAEHMTVHAQERGEVLSLESVRKYSTAHPRCGTAFLLVVMVVAIIVFVIVGREPFWWLIASRIVLMPFIAAVSYELIRLSGRYSGNPLVALITGPSLALQALTTREPEDDQIEIAITAMRRTLEVDDKGIALVESEYSAAESSADETGQP
ncbi:MAG: DUF1385 domain-containing protein [Chloroflexi bacterium]|nr:DUF1385 domain-containing protein [Chloroflexota bacterium]